MTVTMVAPGAADARDAEAAKDVEATFANELKSGSLSKREGRR